MLKDKAFVKWDKWKEKFPMERAEYREDTKEDRILDSTDLKTGLTTEQAAERREIYGPNQLKEGHRKTILQLFWEQLNDPLIYILMAAIAVSLFLGEAGESIIIAAVILLNAVVGVIQEGKALKAIEALQKLSCPKALVKRDGREMEIVSSELVPGDLIFLEAGSA